MTKPRLPRLSRRSLLATATVLGAVFVSVLYWADRSGWLVVWFPALAPPPLNDGGTGELLKVRDGDTVEVRYHDLTLAVRLRGVDTEESVHPDAARNTSAGRATSAWAKAYLFGQQVRVEFVREGWEIARDRYGRALGFLWIDRPPHGIGSEDELYNETVIRLGHSSYITKFGTAGVYHGRFQAAEAEAKREKRGQWGR